MRIFVYEHITGGGTLSDGTGAAPAGCLLTEGQAMARALVADFAAIPGVEVLALRDARLDGFDLPHCRLRTVTDAPAHRLGLRKTAAAADATLLVAPEAGGILQDCCHQVAAAGGRMISPCERAVEAASDKMRLAQRLARAGVPTPLTRSVKAGESLPASFPYPAVLKPVRGAGSIDVQLVRSPTEWNWPDGSDRRGGWIIQQFVVGQPVSVALLCRRSERHPLTPCRQRLLPGRFQYLGGELPLANHLANRAVRLADAAVARALPEVVGYLGVDLVLGEDPAGGCDAVIEINPRVTTSYVGLRVSARENLAAAILAVADGHRPDVRFSKDPLEFDADGSVRLASRPGETPGAV